MARTPKTEPTTPPARKPGAAKTPRTAKAPRDAAKGAQEPAPAKPVRVALGARKLPAAETPPVKKRIAAMADDRKPARSAPGAKAETATRGKTRTASDARPKAGASARPKAVSDAPPKAVSAARPKATSGEAKDARGSAKPKSVSGSGPARGAKVVVGAAILGAGVPSSAARSGVQRVAKAGADPARRATAAKPQVPPQARIALGAGNAQVKPRIRPVPKNPARIAPGPTSEAEALAAAEPKRARARKRPAPMAPDRLELLVSAAVKSLEDDKAEDVRVLDVTGRASFTDRIIIATGLADRQISAMATHLEEALAKEGMRLKRNAIEASPDWVLIDCGDMVIHLFKPEARETFRLEKMWGEDSPKADSGSGYEPG